MTKETQYARRGLRPCRFGSDVSYTSHRNAEKVSSQIGFYLKKGLSIAGEVELGSVYILSNKLLRREIPCYNRKDSKPRLHNLTDKTILEE